MQCILHLVKLQASIDILDKAEKLMTKAYVQFMANCKRTYGVWLQQVKSM